MVFKWFEFIDVLTLILSVVFFSDLKRYKMGGFALLIFLVCVTEIVASNYILFGWKSNYRVYNYYMVYSTAVIFYCFGKILNYSGIVKRIYYGASIISMCVLLLNLTVIQGGNVYNNYSSIFTSFISALLGMLVICKLFLDDDSTVMLLDNPYFWIAGSTLIFSMGSMVTMGLQQFILSHKIQLDGKSVYRVIMPILSAFLYGSYSYSFILCRKQTIRSS